MFWLALASLGTATSVDLVYLSEVEMQILAKRVREGLQERGRGEADLPAWDLAQGWPAADYAWRVDPVPADLLAVAEAGEMSTSGLARMLRMRFDRDERSEWAFVPMENCVVVLRPAWFRAGSN